MRRLLVPSLCTALSLGACSDDPGAVKGQRVAITPDAAQTAALTNTRALAMELWEAQKWLGETDGVSTIEDLVGGEDAPSPVPALPNGLVLPEDQLEFEQMLDDVESFLDERVFVDSQIESSSSTEIIYKLDPAVVCGTGEDAGEDCVELLTEVEVRVRATRYREADVDLDVLVGAGRDKLFGLELHEDLISLTADLSGAAEVAEALFANDAEAGATAPSVQLAGELNVSVRRLTADKLRLEGAVVSAISITVDDGDEDVRLEAAPGKVALEIEQGADKAILDLDVGRVSVTAPKSALMGGEECTSWTEVDENGNETWYEECQPIEPTGPTGPFTFSCEGVAAYVELDDTTDDIGLDGLVIGPIKLLSGAETAVELVIGEGQPFDFTLSVADDSALLSLSRALEASLMLRMGSFEDVFEDMPTWTKDEMLEIALAGTTPSLVMHDTGMVVGAGTTLTLTSRLGDPTTVSAAANQCVYWPEESADVPLDPGTPGTPTEPVPAEETDEWHPFEVVVGAECPAPSGDTTEPAPF